MDKKISRPLIFAAALVLANLGQPADLWASTETLIHPNLARGQNEAHRYSQVDMGEIDLFNGNLHLTLPIGQRYPVDARIHYGLELHYNSQIWDFDGSTDGDGEPMAHSNAGLGFDLSFGRLIEPASGTQDPWIFVAPGGSAHRFFSDLHEDTPDVGDPNDLFQYTRDSTYLRLQHVSSSERRLEFSDGTVRRFAKTQGEWRVDRISAADGSHSVDISYGSGDYQWTLTDSHGRAQRIFLVADPADPTRRLVDRLELTAFGGATAIYQLSYSQVAIARPCTDSRGATVTVSLLTGLTDPLGDARSFAYHDSSAGCEADGRLETARMASGGSARWDYGSYTFPNLSCEASTPAFLEQSTGVVQRQRVAPDGSLHGTWTYTPEHSAGAGCAVDERRTVVTTPLGDQWVYYFGAGGDGSSVGDAADYALPVSDSHVDSALGTPDLPMALAFEVFDCDPGGSSCELLRSQWEAWRQDFRCADSGGLCFETQRRLERRRLIYHADDPVGGAARFRDVSHADFDGLGHYRSIHRTSNFGRADSLLTFRALNAENGSYVAGASSGTGPGTGISSFVLPSLSEPWLLDDAAMVSTQDDQGHQSVRDICYDAFGQRIRERRRGSSPSTHDLVTAYTWASGRVISTAHYGGDLQAIPASADLCAMQLPASAAYRRQDTFQSGVLATSTWLEPDGTPMPYSMTDVDIDPSTGLIAAKRDTSGLETIFLYDVLGRLTWERPESGQGAWKQISHQAPRLDQPTQNVGAGRYIFHRPNGQPSGPVLSQSFEQEDAFGRLSMERGWTSGSQNRRKLYRYDALDHRIKYTPWHYIGDVFVWSENLDIDPFGRTGRILPPDGSEHETTFVYRGIRETVKTERVEKSFSVLDGLCQEADMVTTITNDGLERMWKMRIDRPEPWPGETVEIERHYLPNGDPIYYQEKRTVSDAHQLTRKTYSYDNRGLLSSAEHLTGTETTLDPTLTLSYSDYDARGLHHGETRSGELHGALGIGSIRSYDAAGRLIQVSDAETPSKIWKEFIYAPNNGPADASGRVDLRRGKLQRTVRHNYTRVNLPAHHTVEEVFEYHGIGGQKSELTTTVATVSHLSSNFDLSRSVRTSATYDELGRIDTLSYPDCLQCSTGEPTAERHVSYTYDWLGRTSSVTGTWDGAAQDWVSSGQWSAGRVPTEIVHANGVRDVITGDVDGIDRPGRIEVLDSASTPLFDTGTMAYDGRGDLCGYGSSVLVSVPDEIEAQDTENDVCLSVISVDPFGRWNGESETAPGCQIDLGLRSYTLYDAWDRVVGVLDLEAREQVQVGTETEWIRDPESYAHYWYHFGPTGQMLRLVRSHYQGEWQRTFDYVRGFERTLGMARVQPFTGNISEQRHLHPLMFKQTSPEGWVMNPWQ